jgi:hypothetical protein
MERGGGNPPPVFFAKNRHGVAEDIILTDTGFSSTN